MRPRPSYRSAVCVPETRAVHSGLISQATPGVSVLLVDRLRPVATPVVEMSIVSKLLMRLSVRVRVTCGAGRYMASTFAFWRLNASPKLDRRENVSATKS